MKNNSSTNTSSFEACYGYLTRSPLDFKFDKYVTIDGHINMDNARKFIDQIQLKHHIMQEQLEKSQSSYKARHDKHCVDKKLYVGDEVRLYIEKQILQEEGKKLKPIHYGQFKILENIGTNAFKLDFSPCMQIYFVNNVENLR